MTSPPTDPSVHEEPHLRGRGYQFDSSEARADQTLRNPSREEPSEDEKVEHSVWDEPGLSPPLAGSPRAGDLTYPAWLEKRRKDFTPARSWTATLVIALLAGPWAVVGAFLSGNAEGAVGIVMLVVFGPLVEEIMKTAIPLCVVEKRPFLFRSSAQIAVCVLAGALVFAAIENVLYLHVYVPHLLSAGHESCAVLMRWRWTVCVALHMGCSSIAGLGIVRIWRDVRERRARPRLFLGYPYVLAAVIVHGSYNALAVTLAAAGFGF